MDVAERDQTLEQAALVLLKNSVSRITHNGHWLCRECCRESNSPGTMVDHSAECAVGGLERALGLIENQQGDQG